MTLHLHDHRGYVGALAHETVREAYAYGGYDPDTLSWKPGERAWIRLGQRWGRRRPAALAWASVCGLLACVLAGVVVPIWTLRSPLQHPLPTWLQLGGVSVLVLATALACAMYVVRSRGQVRSHARARLAAWTLVALLPLIAALVYQCVIMDRIRHRQPDARMTLNPQRTVLSINGFVSAGFVDDFHAALERAPALERIEIESSGGLLIDAMQVAREIHRRELTVRVTTYCASACVMLWAASPSRELGLHASIGLHRASIEGDMPKEWRESALAKLEAQSGGLLSLYGFSPRLLAKWRDTPAVSMAWVNANDFLYDGVSLRVLNAHGQAATPAEIATIGASDLPDTDDDEW